MSKPTKGSPKGSKKSSSPGSPLSPISEIDPGLLCPSHKEEFTLFNDVTEKPLCLSCLAELGPGAHKVTSLEEAYRYRLAAVHNTLNSHLFNKKEQLLARLHRTEYRLEELKRVQLLIERDTRSEFQSILDRLHSSANLKESLLSNDLSELQQDLDRIDYISQSVDSGGQDMSLFLSQFPKLRNAAEFATAKPFKTVLEVSPEDLPNEMVRLGECLEDREPYQNLVAFKDEVLWRLLHERAGGAEVRNEVKTELNSWVALSDKLLSEVERLQLVCEYCNQSLSSSTANSPCSKNTGFVLANRESGEGQERSKGNGRHFFAKPKPVPTAFPRASQPSIPSVSLQPDEILTHLRTLVREKPILAEDLFKEYDVLGTGTVTPTDFYQVLNSVFSLSGSQVSSLAGKYDSEKCGRINYRRFNQDLMAEFYGFIERAKDRIRSLREEFKHEDFRLGEKVSMEVFAGVLRRCGFNSLDVNFGMRMAEVTPDGQILYPQFLTKVSSS